MGEGWRSPSVLGPEGLGPEEKVTEEPGCLGTAAQRHPWHHHEVATGGTARPEGVYDRGKA